MTPEQEQLLNEVNRKVDMLYAMFRNPAQIDPQFAQTITAVVGDIYLNDLKDVTITSPSNTEVLKYNGTIWVNDTDAT